MGHEHFIERVNLLLEVRLDVLRKGLMRVAINLAIPGIDEGVGVPLPGVRFALVTMCGDHADRPDRAGSGKPNPVGAGRDSVARR